MLEVLLLTFNENVEQLFLYLGSTAIKTPLLLPLYLNSKHLGLGIYRLAHPKLYSGATDSVSNNLRNFLEEYERCY